MNFEGSSRCEQNCSKPSQGRPLSLALCDQGTQFDIEQQYQSGYPEDYTFQRQILSKVGLRRYKLDSTCGIRLAFQLGFYRDCEP